MQKTSIEWADYSANLLKYRDAAGKVVWACAKVSPGCAHCYAETIAHRYGKGSPFTLKQVATVKPFFDVDEAKQIIRSKPVTGAKVFVDDMTDLFGEWVPDDVINKHLAVFALRRDVTFQVLTKRPERMQAHLSDPGLHDKVHAAVTHMIGYDNPNRPAINRRDLPLPNVWWGTSVEDQKRADERVPLLLQTPAAVRFLSCEPLLGPVDLTACAPYTLDGNVSNPGVMNAFNGLCYHPATVMQKPEETGTTDGIRLVIIGGESGRGARACDLAWIRSLVKQCGHAEVAAFVKQLGSLPYQCEGAGGCNVDPAPCRKRGGNCALSLIDSKGGLPGEWPADLRVRSFPA